MANLPAHGLSRKRLGPVVAELFYLVSQPCLVAKQPDAPTSSA